MSLGHPSGLESLETIQQHVEPSRAVQINPFRRVCSNNSCSI